MCEESTDRERLAAIERCILSGSLNQPRVVQTIFRPHPLGEISGKKIWFATTAPDQAGEVLRKHLESNYQTEVVAMSHALADRDRLRHDLQEASKADAIVVELKAAAVDVVTRYALDAGKEVIYLDNRPQAVRGGSLQEGFESLAEKALRIAGSERPT